MRIIQIKNHIDLEKAFAIRRQVFCIEQHVPEDIEMDEYDQTAIHILALIGNDPVGTARWRFTKEGVKMERFAVLKDHRKNGIGQALVYYILNELISYKYIYLNAQESVIKFYEKFGFVAIESRFYEAGIPHKKMVLES